MSIIRVHYFEELRHPNPSPYAAFTSSLHRSTTDILSSCLKSLLKLITCFEITVIFDSYRQIYQSTIIIDKINIEYYQLID